MWEGWRKSPVPGIPIDREHMDPNGGVISMPPAEIDLPEPVPRPEPRRLGVIDCEMEGNDE